MTSSAADLTISPKWLQIRSMAVNSMKVNGVNLEVSSPGLTSMV
ncbi:hypothetical protein LINPERPRIM_LOCUS19439 [Linum perenne]